ncbi:MAG: hypothetical protein CME61_07945 [Halobacteriovoraceae bacterium]|nr:hypothetical protein [Halobacteriovoraceae bacterium]
MRLYYYTGPNHVEENLKRKRLKLSRFGVGGKLNDPFELSAYNLNDKAFRKVHKKISENFASKIGFLCLSETKHSPLMWAHYTKNHHGICLELEVEYDPLFKINYEEERLFPGITLANHKQYINIGNIKKIMGTKSRDWSYEEEWRMQVPLDSEAVEVDGDGRVFLPFQNRRDLNFNLKKIYVGYRCNLGINNLQRWVKDHRYTVEIVQTRPAFETFSVVKQKNRAFWNWDVVADGDPCPAEKALHGADG